MGSPRKLHVGFPERSLDKYLSILVNSGHKVAVVEQTETPKQMERRLKKEIQSRRYSGGENQPYIERLVKREVCNVVTKGTFLDTR